MTADSENATASTSRSKLPDTCQQLLLRAKKKTPTKYHTSNNYSAKKEVDRKLEIKPESREGRVVVFIIENLILNQKNN